MPLTMLEGAQDIPLVIGAITDIEAAIAALPPVADRKLSDYCALAGTILTKLGPLADAVEGQIKS